MDSITERTGTDACHRNGGKGIERNKINANVIQIQTTLVHSRCRDAASLQRVRCCNHRTYRIPDSIFGVPSTRERPEPKHQKNVDAQMDFIMPHSDSVMRIGARIDYANDKTKIKWEWWHFFSHFFVLFLFHLHFPYAHRALRLLYRRSRSPACRTNIETLFFFLLSLWFHPNTRNASRKSFDEPTEWRCVTCACHSVCRISL